MSKQKAQTELTSVIGIQIEYLTKQGYSPDEVKHIIVSNMLEEALDLAANEDYTEYNSYVLLPLFKALLFLLNEEMKKKTADAYIPQVAADLQNLSEIVSYLKSRVERIEKK